MPKSVTFLNLKQSLNGSQYCHGKKNGNPEELFKISHMEKREIKEMIQKTLLSLKISEQDQKKTVNMRTRSVDYPKVAETKKIIDHPKGENSIITTPLHALTFDIMQQVSERIKASSKVIGILQKNKRIQGEMEEKLKEESSLMTRTLDDYNWKSIIHILVY